MFGSTRVRHTGAGDIGQWGLLALAARAGLTPGRLHVSANNVSAQVAPNLQRCPRALQSRFHVKPWTASCMSLPQPHIWNHSDFVVDVPPVAPVLEPVDEVEKEPAS
jgi:hypothetical protein